MFLFRLILFLPLFLMGCVGLFLFLGLGVYLIGPAIILALALFEALLFLVAFVFVFPTYLLGRYEKAWSNFLSNFPKIWARCSQRLSSIQVDFEKAFNVLYSAYMGEHNVKKEDFELGEMGITIVAGFCGVLAWIF